MIYLLITLYLFGMFNTLLMFKVGKEANFIVERGWWLAVIFWPVCPIWVFVSFFIEFFKLR